MITEARRRLVEKPAGYYPEIYGVNEAGGTSVFILSAVPFSQIGYNTQIPKSSMPQFTWNILQHIPQIVVVGTVMMGGIYWITSRREDVAREEGRQ
jgi:formate dehydrogenase iron-sulfur subunit